MVVRVTVKPPWSWEALQAVLDRFVGSAAAIGVMGGADNLPGEAVVAIWESPWCFVLDPAELFLARRRTGPV